MTQPGPKPVSVEELANEAQQWATVLFCLRDGQVGMLEKLKWGPWRTVPAARPSQEILDLMKGTPWEGAPMLKTKKQSRQQIGTPLVAKIVPADPKIVKHLSKFVNNPDGDYTYIPPVLPAPNVWNKLKKCRSRTEMRLGLRLLERYLAQNFGMWSGREYPRALERYAPELFVARKLAAYPGSKERPSSDDKRVVFIAKVFAGARFGLTASYATKKLSRLNFSKYSADKPYREFVKNVQAMRRGT